MTTLRVWAPDVELVEVDAKDTRTPMIPRVGGWWEVDVPDLDIGDDYAFVLDGGDPLPDPRSLHQPNGVHGPSRVVDPAAFPWTDAGWNGLPLAGGVIYELHVGTFTPEGTLDAAIGKLDHLAELGVDLVELLPVNAFPGNHGWGYDGVALYAVHDAYGGPAALARFVDAAHARGLGVIMDVVYNHLGPSGNYLGRFGPYFTTRHRIPWGSAVNYDDVGSAEVRRFVLDNARMWFRDYHLDGLRLDAIHAIIDTSAVPILEELASETEALSAHLRRTKFLIAESDLNDPRIVRSREAGGTGIDAQWSDDFHHALHALLTGERTGYYTDFGGLDDLATAFAEGYVYAGEHSAYRGRVHGRRPLSVPAHRFLGYLQDHDQVGNRARGERSAALMSDGLLRVGAALVLLSPFTPMLWMGEEWGASTPWMYFTDHDDPALAEAVRTGRQAEFGAFGWRPEEAPDPQDPATFTRSRLDWSELSEEPHAGLLDWHRKLLSLRRTYPEFPESRFEEVSVAYDEEARWLVLGRGRTLVVVCNFGPERQEVPVDGTPVDVLAASTTGFAFGPGAVDLDAESVAVVRLVSPHPEV
ncbi:MAG: malto-oligosyltrehalose trehalohydrolase [Frankiaceae bacterium]